MVTMLNLVSLCGSRGTMIRLAGHDMSYVLYVLLIGLLIFVGVAVVAWFVGDFLDLWFPEYHAKMKRTWCFRVLKRPERTQDVASEGQTEPAEGAGHRGLRARDASLQQLRDAAAHVATYSLSQGKGVSESIEDAIAYIRSRTKEWRNEGDIRRWLAEELNSEGQTERKLFDFRRFSKRELVVVSIGILVAFALGWLTRGGHAGDRFSIHVMSAPSRVRAIKLDKSSGETWSMDMYGRWTNDAPVR